MIYNIWPEVDRSGFFVSLPFFLSFLLTIFFCHPGASSVVALGPSDTAYSEGFTLGLSKLSKPDITTDIFHCDTTVDVQPDSTACDVFQSEEESRSRSHYIEREAARDSQTEEDDGDSEPKTHVSARSGFVEEEDDTAKDSQTEEGDEDSQSEVDGSTRSQSQEDQETAQNAEEERGGDSQPKVDVSARSQSVEEQEETAQDSQTVNAQTKDVSAVDCHSEEEENIANDERDHKNLTEEELPCSQDEDEELEEGGDGHQSEEQEHDEHLNYRDPCSGGGVIHATEPDGVTSEMGENSKKMYFIVD